MHVGREGLKSCRQVEMLLFVASIDKFHVTDFGTFAGVPWLD
jgi:hypothetical protein